MEPLPIQRQKSTQWSSAGPSRLAPETPRRPRFGIISDFEKQKKSNLPEIRDLPSGFQTGSQGSQSMAGRKGKEVNSFIPPVSYTSAPVIGEHNHSPRTHLLCSQMLVHCLTGRLVDFSSLTSLALKWIMEVPQKTLFLLPMMA